MEQYPLLTHIKNPNNSHRTAKKREHLDNFFIIIFFLAVFFGDLFDSQLNMQCVTSYFAMVKISKLYANMRPCRRCLVLRLRYCINCIFTGTTLINYMENKHFFCELRAVVKFRGSPDRKACEWNFSILYKMLLF